MLTRIPFLFVFFAVLLLGACNAESEPSMQVDMADMTVSEKICGLPQPSAPPSICSDKADGEPCDDGDVCTHGDACVAGVCQSDTPGRLCVRCRDDADCCAGVGSIMCDSDGYAWAPIGKCTADGVCAMDRKGCLVGESCVPGMGCKGQ